MTVRRYFTDPEVSDKDLETVQILWKRTVDVRNGEMKRLRAHVYDGVEEDPMVQCSVRQQFPCMGADSHCVVLGGFSGLSAARISGYNLVVRVRTRRDDVRIAGQYNHQMDFGLRLVADWHRGVSCPSESGLPLVSTHDNCCCNRRDRGCGQKPKVQIEEKLRDADGGSTPLRSNIQFKHSLPAIVGDAIVSATSRLRLQLTVRSLLKLLFNSYTC
ncbi:hypothetical protein J6590_024504 [Homalodisca vitripennis]|nr:hypothetical protein J6590_024504 [Homalodisca vitripennis]